MLMHVQRQPTVLFDKRILTWRELDESTRLVLRLVALTVLFTDVRRVVPLKAGAGTRGFQKDLFFVL